MRGSRRLLEDRAFSYLVIGAAAFVTSSFLLPWSDWPDSQSGLRYAYLLDQFCDAFRHGVVYPRWLPNAFGGYGYPTFVYYQPGFFFWCLPLGLLLGDVPQAMYLSVLGLLVLGAAGAYRLCALLAGRTCGLFGAILFLLTPYLYVNLYVRGDLSELMAMLIVPWPWYFFVRLASEENATRPGVATGVVFLGGTTAAVIYSHPATALFLLASLVLASLSLAACRAVGRHTLFRLVLGLALGVVLAIPYWFPALTLRDRVAHETAIEGYFTPSNHSVYADQFFSRKWMFGYSMPGREDLMPMSLGLAHFALAAAGAFAQRRQTMFRVMFVLYLGLVLFMTPVCGFIWDRVLWLRYVQFPWRVLSVTATLQVACACGLHEAIASLGRLRHVVLGLACFGIIGWQIEQFSANRERLTDVTRRLEHHRRTLRDEFRSYAATDEFTPRTAARIAEVGPRQSRPLLESRQPAGAALVIEGDEYRFRCVVPRGAALQVVINQLWFPGWKARLNGRLLTDAELEQQRLPDGRMRLLLSNTEEHELSAWYGRPPDASRHVKVMVISLALIALGLVLALRTNPRVPK